MKRSIIIASLAVTLAFVAFAACAYAYTSYAAMTLPLSKIAKAISVKP